MTKHRSECIHGHPFTPENTYHIPSTGQRACIACRLNRRGVVGQKPRPVPAATIVQSTVSPIVAAWPLAMCAELPLDGPYIPVNP